MTTVTQAPSPTLDGILVVRVPLVGVYGNDAVKIDRKVEVLLTIPLMDGPGRITTTPVPVGELRHSIDRTLMATLTMSYIFDPDTRTITLYADDLVSPAATRITTYPRDAPQYGNEHFAHSPYAVPSDPGSGWVYGGPLTVGLPRELQDTVKQANQAIFDAAFAEGLAVVRRSPFPAMPRDEYEKMFVVLKDNKFVESFDPAKRYDATHMVVHLESFYNGPIFLQANQCFVNVIGTTADIFHTPPGAGLGSWIAMWRWGTNFGPGTIACASTNYFGPPPPAALLCSGAAPIGGHVVLGGTVARQMPRLSNNLFIIPICQRHNQRNANNMLPIAHNTGVQIVNYLTVADSAGLD